MYHHKEKGNCRGTLVYYRAGYSWHWQTYVQPVPFISLELVMLTVTLSNKVTVSYRDIQMTTCILTFQFTWSARDSSMATVVDLSKHYNLSG